MGSSGSAGGGLSQSYVGYNIVGGSVENQSGFKTYYKQITLSKAGLIASIEAYIKSINTSNAEALAAGILTDNAGTPGNVIGYSMDGVHGLYILTTPRWVSVPCGKWLTAGTYWMALQFSQVGGVSNVGIAYDATGTDVIATNAQAGQYIADTAGITPPALTVTANAYSIRGVLLS